MGQQLKGYPSKIIQTMDNPADIHVTAEPIRSQQHGVSTVAHMFVALIGSDAVEAASTTSKIVATAHTARVGDIIAFTAGALSGREVKVGKVDTNNIYTAEVLPSSPSAAVTFDILRHIYPRASTSGFLQTTASGTGFTKDGVVVSVTEDTVNPANNIPLPVKVIASLDTQFIHRHVYSVTAVTTAAYVELIASSSADISKLQIFDSSGQTLVIALGAAAAEVDKLFVVPGGNGEIECRIPAATRISVKAVSANATLGELTINFIG